MLSMTAFASREIQLSEGQLRWDIKSVNHRYFEPVFKLPDPFQDLEYSLRDILRQKVHRGKIQCNLYVEKIRTQKKLEIDLEWVEELIAASQFIKDRLKTVREISPLEILSWPDITKRSAVETQTLQKPIQNLFEETLVGLLKERIREGVELKDAIQQRVNKISFILVNLKERLPRILSVHRERLLEKISGLKVNLDPNRLEQEMVFIAQKIDIAEEVERLEAHIKAVYALLESDHPVGRQLDFLMQELNREANTLGSKSTDIFLTQDTVELKVYIEQMREQIQNVE